MSGLVPVEEYTRLANRCERLEAELADLRHERREQHSLARVAACRKALGLTPQEATVLIEIADQAPRIVTLDHARGSIPGCAEDTDTGRLLRVLISRIRTKTVRHGAPRGIENIHGSGYRASATYQAWLYEQMGEPPMAEQGRHAA